MPVYLQGWLIALASGLAMTLMGVCYRAASGRDIHPSYLLCAASVVGASVFALDMLLHSGWALPPVVWALGIVAGLSQAACINLTPLALRRGPLSAYWGATMLAFIPVLVYAAVALHEPFKPLHWPMLGAALLAIGAAAFGTQGGEGSPTRRRRAVDKLIFAVLLVAILLLNGAASVFVKAMAAQNSQAGSVLDQYRGGFFMLLYLGVVAVTGLQIALDRSLRPSLAPTLWLSIGMTAGSLGATCLLVVGARYPAVIFFPVSSIVAILGASLAGVWIFRERIGASWLITVAACIAAVLCAAFAR